MGRKINIPRVLGVLAGQDLAPESLAKWARSADVVLAADGAADALRAVDLIPHAAVGDLDSISDSTKEIQLELIQIDDQESTDCDKLLGLAAARGYSEITLIGVEGDLLDHVLGNLYSSARSPLRIRLALRRGVTHILHGPVEREFHVPDSARLSLMPLTKCGGVTLSGVTWPLSGATLHVLGKTSISNRGSGLVGVRIQSGSAALFLSHPDLERPHWGAVS